MQETRVPHPGLGRSLWEGNGNPLEYSCLGNPKGRRAFSLVQLFSRVRLFATQWTVTHQASLSITNSWSLLKLMPIKLVMPLILQYLDSIMSPSKWSGKLTPHTGLVSEGDFISLEMRLCPGIPELKEGPGLGHLAFPPAWCQADHTFLGKRDFKSGEHTI